jgi:signal transduction histidine kinase
MGSQALTPSELEQLLDSHPVLSDIWTAPPESPLVRLLASMDRDLLTQLMTEHRYSPGEIVCEEGERGDAMYLIWSGRVAVIKGDIQSPNVLFYRGPGEVIGEMALLEDQPRSASIVALDNLHLLRIDREGFQQWVASTPEIGLSIMASLSARLRASDNVLYAGVEVEKKLAHQVSELETDKQQLLELQRVRQETSDLIVHDLRNPLGIIYSGLNMLEMVLPEDILDVNRELLDLATSACERMQRLVDSLLDVSKLETGEMPLKLTTTNLRPLLDNAGKRQSIATRTRDVVLRIDIPTELPLVAVDSEMLERILANLIDNAFKYSPNGEQIVVSAEVGTNEIIISVADAGPGIPPHERERIFERFTQVEGTQLQRRGFGLGLTFCRLAVEAHGGEIWVEDGPGGKGSRFVFTLPFDP